MWTLVQSVVYAIRGKTQPPQAPRKSRTQFQEHTQNISHETSKLHVSAASGQGALLTEPSPVMFRYTCSRKCLVMHYLCAYKFTCSLLDMCCTSETPVTAASLEHYEDILQVAPELTADTVLFRYCVLHLRHIYTMIPAHITLYYLHVMYYFIVFTYIQSSQSEN